MRCLWVLLLGFVAAFSAAPQADPWAGLRFLDGKWKGQASGEPGKGITSREYRFDLGGRFLSARSRSVYEPRSPAAKPEIHEDFSVFSYDQTLKKVVLRQFHVEGFVNEYTLDSMSEDRKRFYFVTVRIENIAPGWRARESYQVVSADEFVETFSLAEPDKDFVVYSESRLKRVK